MVSTSVVVMSDEEVSDGTRTRDRLDHNQELYQLSYAHHGDLPVTSYAAPPQLVGTLG